MIGVDEREPTGSTIYNALLYFDAEGNLLGKHRKLVPTGLERTVWGMGDGSTLDTYPTPFGRIGGLICWENYMPLARFYLYSQGVDVWVAPTPATGDGWVATMQTHRPRGSLLRDRCESVRARRPDPGGLPRSRPRVAHRSGGPRLDGAGNTVIVDTNGEILAGPVRHAETILTAELDLTNVLSARRLFDPVGHYHRPDVFRLAVDTSPRPVVTTLRNGFADD